MSQDINLDLIDRDPGQPRRYFDPEKLAELAQSMQEKGLIQPILVRPTGDRYTIIHGERRYRAARALGWAAIAADVRAVDEDEARWLALIENVQRADLTPLEEAEAYRGHLEGGLTQAELGQRIGKSQSYIAQKLRLLTLPEPLQLYLARGALTEGHGRQLLRLRATYMGVTRDISNWVTEPPLDEALPELEAWAGLAPIMFRDIRPEDCPPVWILPEAGQPLSPLLAEGCRAFFGYAHHSGGTLPQWEITAFWWGSATVYLGLTVHDLAKAIDNWQARFETALCFLELNPDPPQAQAPKSRPSPWETLKAIEWWGHYADLRHAGATKWFGALPEDERGRLFVDLILKLGPLEAGFILPSSCQPWGFSYKQWQELKDKTADLAA